MEKPQTPIFCLDLVVLPIICSITRLLVAATKPVFGANKSFRQTAALKVKTDAFARSILAANVNVPFYRFIGAFGDLAIANGGNTSYEYWDYGLYIEFIPDFLEIYFPFQNSQQMLITEPNYYKQIRFVLNIELDAVMNRVRRGWY